MEHSANHAKRSVGADRSILVHHLMRSGGHGFLNWLFPQINGELKFFNNFDPELSIEDHVMRPWNYGRPDAYFDLATGYRFKHARESILGLIGGRVANFVYSCEDFDPDWILPQINSNNHITVILLRDPYNMLASRMAGFGGLYPRRAQRISRSPIVLWKQHAQKCLTEEVLPVLFNKWTNSVEYRQEISRKLGLNFTDEGLDGNADARKSSYAITEKGREHERWKHSRNDPYYLSLFDSEMVQLASKLFPELGHIPVELGLIEG